MAANPDTIFETIKVNAHDNLGVFVVALFLFFAALFFLLFRFLLIL